MSNRTYPITFVALAALSALFLVFALGGCTRSPLAPSATVLPVGGAVSMAGRTPRLDAADLPFRGHIDGHLVTSPTSDPTILDGVAQAVGIGTQLGSFTKVTHDVIDLATDTVTGSFTMTAANGDLLRGVYSGPFVFGAPGTFSWVLQSTITGGTGRFSGASGAFVFKANVAFTGANGVFNGTYSETFDGTISH